MIVRRNRDYLNNLFPERVDLGDNFSLRKIEPFKLIKFLAKYFRRYREKLNSRNEVGYDVFYKEVMVGFIFFEENKQNFDEVYVSGIRTKKTFEGHKIAQRALGKILEFLKEFGYRKVTLDVLEESPNARHIYEKFGFTDVGDRYERLTPMKLDLTKFKL